MSSVRVKQFMTNYLTLFSSMGTLICCALPATLVSLGMGSAFLSLTTAFPQLIWISEHKKYLFWFSLLMLCVSTLTIYLNRNAACPIDPILRDTCIKGRQYTKVILVISWIAFIVGFFFSYLAA